MGAISRGFGPGVRVATVGPCRPSALSKVLPPHQVGRWMGYQASAGSAGRVVGPLLAGYVYQAYAQGLDGRRQMANALVTGEVSRSFLRPRSPLDEGGWAEAL